MFAAFRLARACCGWRAAPLIVNAQAAAAAHRNQNVLLFAINKVKHDVFKQWRVSSVAKKHGREA